MGNNGLRQSSRVSPTVVEPVCQAVFLLWRTTAYNMKATDTGRSEFGPDGKAGKLSYTM